MNFRKTLVGICAGAASLAAYGQPTPSREQGTTPTEKTIEIDSVQKVCLDSTASASVNALAEALKEALSNVDLLESGTIRLKNKPSLEVDHVAPLIVVDGVPIRIESEKDIDFTICTKENYASLLGIPPGDIETVEILKDSAATALYGPRAKYGVILIQSKPRGSSNRESESERGPGTTVWHSESYPRINSVSGSPMLVDTPIGAAVRFDGDGDAVFIGENPLAGLKEFTVEVIFRPAGDGEFAQRFLHMGTSRGERIVLETRLNPDKTWYFDAHTTLPDGKKVTIIDEKLTHPADRWYNVTLVVYRDRMVTYVNGKPQRWANANFTPFGEGVTSIGVRQNLVDWFKGDIYKIRITPSGLLPKDLLTDHELLNTLQ